MLNSQLHLPLFDGASNLGAALTRVNEGRTVWPAQSKSERSPPDVQHAPVVLAEHFVQIVRPPKEPIVTGLLHKRDLGTLAARRREGKTALLLDGAVAVAAGEPDFLGYPIRAPARVLAIYVEDDEGELQERLRVRCADRDLNGRLALLTREHFDQYEVPINADDERFRKFVWAQAEKHNPSWIQLDNQQFFLAADFNEAKRVHRFVALCRELATTFNAAITVAAHPRKANPEHQVRLADSPDLYFDQVMGSSVMVNQTGSLWGLERDRANDRSVFLGGRQRGNGDHQITYLQLDARNHFVVVNNLVVNMSLVVNTPNRLKAWDLLPVAGVPFSYTEGERLCVPAAMKSSATYHEWLAQCRQKGVVADTPDGKLAKMCK